MALFVTISILLTLVVLAVVLRPLWRDSRPLVLGAFVALCVATIALYQVVGTPATLAPGATRVAAEPGAPTTLEAAIVELQAELERKPQQAEGWRLLGKSLAALQRFDESRDAFVQALKLTPDEPDLLVEAAQSRLYASPERKLDDEAVALLQRALVLKPDHQRGLWFLGMAQRQEGQPAAAAATWESLLPLVEPGTTNTLRQQIDAARSDAGLSPLPAPAAAPTPVATAGNTVNVEVSLDPDFAARVRLRGDATVFIIARVPGGPPMPVAAQKHTLQDLPLNVTLSDADSPMPTQKLSQLKEVELIARISESGNAMRQEGDLESSPVRVSLPSATPVELVLGGAKP